MSQCILSIFPSSVHQFYANILVFDNINPFLYINDQFALCNTTTRPLNKQTNENKKVLFTDPIFTEGFVQNRLLVPACHRLFVFTNLLCYQPGPCNQTIQTWNSYFQSINNKVLQFYNVTIYYRY